MPRQETNLDVLKKEQIDMLQGNCEKGILEKSNVDLLTKLINNAENETEVLAIAQLGTTYKRTGLHYDKKLEKTGDEVKYFVKNEDLSFVTDENAITHKLIIGDNYDALLNLLITHRCKIDVIYIDPPYGKDSMGAFADTNYDNAITRDNLLSMLYPRLTLAKLLLSGEGVIFVSIDDRNHAYVKCLMDEVFGENNFIGNLIIQTATDNNPSQINTEHEYVLCYASHKQSQEKWFIKSENAKKIANEYEKIKKKNTDIGYIQKLLREWIKSHKDELSQVEHYNCVDEKGVYTANTNSSNTKPGGYTYDILHPITNKPCSKPDFGWRWTEETFWNYANNGDVEWGIDETTQPHIKKRLETATEALKSVIYEDGRVATKVLEQIFNSKKIFDNPKPVYLLKRLLSFTTKENSIVLDFFAGSGTTGQAVLALNKEDGGNRQFILCTNNEEADGFIATNVTSKRLKRVMTGKCYDGTSDFKWAEENQPYGDNLEVLEIAKVKNNDRKIFEKIDETFYGKKFEDVKDKIDWVCANFAKTQKCLEDE